MKTLTNCKPLYPELKGKVLFVFSDPGGAKPVLALAEQHQDKLVISDRIHPFYSDFDVDVKPADINYEKIIINYNPTLIFTGTSYRSDIEREFRALARKLHIPCFAFVDHWTAIAERFQNKNGEMVLPQQVWVIDERAKTIAIEKGIPENTIVITGNPYYDWMKQWTPTQSRKKFFDAIGISNEQTRLLLYAPDPLSNVDGITRYGFDELTVARELVELFEQQRHELAEWKMLIKAHPNQNLEKLQEITNGNPMFKILPADIDTNTTLYHADVVVGFFSNVLIEASLLNKPVLRYLPNPDTEDSIKELNIGNIVNRESLVHQLTHTSTVWN